MSMTGPDPEHPDQGGRADLGPAGRDVRRLRRRRQTARTGHAPAWAAWSAPHCWPASSVCTPTRAPGGPSPAKSPQAEGPHHPSICPYGLFHSADGIVQIAVGSEGLWARFAPAFDIPLEGPEFSTNPDRVRNSAVVRAAVEQAFAELLDARPAREAVRDRRAQRRGEEPAAGLRLGPDPFAGSADRRRAPGARTDPAARSAAAVLRTSRAASGTASTPLPRPLGQHTDEVLDWLAETPTGRLTAADLQTFAPATVLACRRVSLGSPSSPGMTGIPVTAYSFCKDILTCYGDARCRRPPRRSGWPNSTVDLDRSSAVPLYHQMAEQIHQADPVRLTSRRARCWATRSALPSKFGLSRPTMRRAIQELVERGVLVRKRGVGTQVVQGPITRSVQLTSLYDDLSRAPISNRTPAC